jgi:hypothetical protein
MMINNTTTMDDVVARYTGKVTRYPPGVASAPDVKERGQAQYQCTCGYDGTMPYPKLFKLLRRRALQLRCERCGRVMR